MKNKAYKPILIYGDRLFLWLFQTNKALQPEASDPKISDFQRCTTDHTNQLMHHFWSSACQEGKGNMHTTI